MGCSNGLALSTTAPVSVRRLNDLHNDKAVRHRRLLLRNRFVDDHEAQAPFGYPEIHYLTGPLRAASVRAGDPHATNIWAGTGFKSIKTGPVAEIIKDLT